VSRQIPVKTQHEGSSIDLEKMGAEDIVAEKEWEAPIVTNGKNEMQKLKRCC